jgi:glycosyltransferase involved in cell wall biosynthesis
VNLQAGGDSVTVVVPVYNGGSRITSTLETLKAQTHQNWSCILINDGSTDNSLMEIGRFISSNPKLEINVITSKNFGAGSARNTGLLKSNSGFVAFLDQDDLWDTRKLEKQVKFLETNPDFSGVLCNYTISGLNNQSTLKAGRLIKNRELSKLAKGWLSLTGNGALLSSTFLFRKNEFTCKIFFDPKFSYVADLDYFLSFITSNRIAIIEDSLVTYLQHDGQMHSDSKGLLIEYPKLLEKWDVSKFGLKKNELLGNMYALCLLLESRKGNFKLAFRMLIFSFMTNRLSILRIPLAVFRKRLISTSIRLVERF